MLFGISALEQLYSLLSKHVECAVHAAVVIAQLLKARLQRADLRAGRAERKRYVRLDGLGSRLGLSVYIILRRRRIQEFLQRTRCDAGCGIAVERLEGADRVLRLLAEEAVRFSLQVAELL